MTAGRRRVPAVLGALLCAAAALLCGPAAAGAGAGQPSAQVTDLEVTPGHVRFVLTTANLSSDQPLHAGLVTVEAGDELVPTVVTTVDAVEDVGTPAPPRALMVVMDSSGSMGESGIAAARQAAQILVAGLPADVEIGLVAFGTTPTLLLGPTVDRAGFDAALAAVRAGGDTSLYDALDTAVTALEAAGFGPSSQRRLIVLSDGDDTASVTAVDVVVGRLAAGAVPTDVVAFQYGGADSAALQQLADAAGGRVLSAADAAQLGTVFADIARSFTQRARVEFEVPSALAGTSVRLRVGVSTSAGTVYTETPVTFAAARPSERPAASDPAAGATAGESVSSVPRWQLPAILGSIFVAVMVVVLLAAGGAGGRVAKQLNAQFGKYGPDRDGVRPTGPVPGGLPDASSGRLDRWLGGGSRAELTAGKLELAGLTIKVSEWRVLRLCACTVPAAVLTLLFGSALLGVPIGVLLGWLVTRMLLNWLIKRRFAAFGEQMPDVLQLIAGSLQSGFSLAQALNSVVRQDDQPAAAEFSRALAETRVGISLEDALDRTAVRMNNPDLRWVVMAVRIQRQVGGNLAEVLLNTVDTMRERAKTRRQVRALSAEGRLSAYILVALPILLGAFLFMTRRDYMRPLYSTPVGVVLLAGAGVMILIGMLWMRKLVQVEV